MFAYLVDFQYICIHEYKRQHTVRTPNFTHGEC